MTPIMAEPRKVVLKLDSGDVAATEHPHPADGTFTAYQRADGRWFGFGLDGSVTWTTVAESYQAFQPAENAAYLISDLSKLGGGVHSVGYLTSSKPFGPSA